MILLTFTVGIGSRTTTKAVGSTVGFVSTSSRIMIGGSVHSVGEDASELLGNIDESVLDEDGSIGCSVILPGFIRGLVVGDG